MGGGQWWITVFVVEIGDIAAAADGKRGKKDGDDDDNGDDDDEELHDNENKGGTGDTVSRLATQRSHRSDIFVLR